jgi:phage terminase large subunit-like protein
MISEGSWTLPSVPPQLLAQRVRQKLEQRLRETRITSYSPYSKQREFHARGHGSRERLFRAGNQLGKSFSGGAEAAYHATGQYPEWWQGKRIEQHNSGWIGAPSGEIVRDGAQRVLLGQPGDWGTGMLPKSSIVDVTRATGVRDLADTVTVQHTNGGTSRIKFKTYDQGRERWQAETLHWVWFDEEPPLDIYLEGLSRTNATGGFIWLTFTPLLGVSDVVMRFLKEKSPDRADIVMTIEDAEHIPEADRQKIIDSYPEHEREARTRGVPILGSGRVFPFPRSLLSIDPFEIPRHWARVGGLDIGWDHPTAAVKLVHDRDADVVYVIEAYRARETTVAVHAGALVPWGKSLPWAWPHDAFSHDKGSGEQIAQLYRTHGLSMLYEHAQFSDDRGNGVEAGLFEMVDRMQTARLKVFSHLNDWFEEFELYHRKDGKVVKERDDLLSATRYGIMMLRHAKALGAPHDPYARSYRPARRGSAMAA